MEEKQLSVPQVFVITNIEVLISNFSADPESYFKTIIELTDANNIAEHKDTMQYLYGLLARNGHLEYAAEFAKKYDIQTANY